MIIAQETTDMPIRISMTILTSKPASNIRPKIEISAVTIRKLRENKCWVLLWVSFFDYRYMLP